MPPLTTCFANENRVVFLHRAVDGSRDVQGWGLVAQWEAKGGFVEAAATDRLRFILESEWVRCTTMMMMMAFSAIAEAVAAKMSFSRLVVVVSVLEGIEFADV